MSVVRGVDNGKHPADEDATVELPPPPRSPQAAPERIEG